MNPPDADARERSARCDEHHRAWAEHGILAVEMEAAGLYTLAAKHGVRALAVVTISDHLITHEVTAAEERQSTFDGMIEVALAAALAAALDD